MKFFLGVITTVVVIGLGVVIYPRFGFLSFNADEQPSATESKLAMDAMDASIKRRAPALRNPVEPTEANLLEAMKLFKTNCALCHGDPGAPERVMGKSFYPPAPQFLKDPPDMPPNHNFYLIKHGIAWTGMPAWGRTLSDDQIWKLTTFLAQMDKLPPAVDQEWKMGATAEVGTTGKGSGDMKMKMP
ncbi:MAG: c-type cytochrome [Terriglobia bacterium]